MIKNYESNISRKYELIQENNKKALENRRLEIEKIIPEVLDIENKIAKLCIEVSINTLKKIENRDEYLNNLKEKITDLKMRKSELLVSKGYPLDYLNMKYCCNKCNDTGYIGPKKCDCYKKYLVESHYNSSELKDILLKNNFSNFRFDLYNDFCSGNEPLSPKANMYEIVGKSKNFINNFSSSNENLLFYGTSGIGKTFLSYCIAKELMDRGNLVLYRTADDLVKDLKDIRFKEDYNLEQMLFNCDLLILDDLGTEPLNDFSKSELFNIVNKRLLINKSMLISSNLSLENIMQTYSERFTSRLFGNFTACKFYGDDIRVKLNLMKNHMSL